MSCSEWAAGWSSDEDFHAEGYADNITNMVCGKFRGVVYDKMQIALRLLETWSKREELNVNSVKTTDFLHMEKEAFQTSVSDHFRL